MTQDNTPKLPGEGEIKTIVKTCVRRECENCGEPATQRHSYLNDGPCGARNNPASSAYGRDDCTWSSDHDLYTCNTCTQRECSNSIPSGYNWCSTFKVERFPHMFLVWKERELKEEMPKSIEIEQFRSAILRIAKRFTSDEAGFGVSEEIFGLQASELMEKQHDNMIEIARKVLKESIDSDGIEDDKLIRIHIMQEVPGENTVPLCLTKMFLILDECKIETPVRDAPPKMNEAGLPIDEGFRRIEHTGEVIITIRGHKTDRTFELNQEQ